MSKLAEQIKKTGKKLREVSTPLGVSPQVVHTMSKIGIKKKTTAIRYAAVLGCNWQDLMD